MRNQLVGEFTVSGSQFLLNGQPMQLLSGAMHYFRIVPEYWRDRLLKLKACGFDAVETYVPWNLHEPRPGEYRFDGGLDLVRYVELAAEVGLHAIVRPGPYICSEWDFGGLPAWLLADPGMRLRCCHPAYLAAVDRYFDELIPRLTHLQITRGGPIIAMQVENEYGYYGNDHEYLRHVEQKLREHGVDVLLFTSDGLADSSFQGGTLPHLLKTGNFGSNPENAFTQMRKYQPDGPLACMEFWNGWFDTWGGQHHQRDPQEVAAVFDDMLSRGASVNFYMFHGGTTFGFMNGANRYDKYTPTINPSYDFGAPLDEAGDPTPKYHAVREVVAKYRPLPDMPVPGPSQKRAYGTVALTEYAPLFSSLSDISHEVRSVTPQSMEMLGQNYGFILYRTQLTGPRQEEPLELYECRDRALVYVDGEYRGLLERDNRETSVRLGFDAGAYQLDILVENQGHVNFGPHMITDRKGISDSVQLGGQSLFHWSIFPLPLDDLSGLRYTPLGTWQGPAFYRGTLTVDEPVDTFLTLPGWTKGNAFLNGFNLGRYWKIGPLRTMYVPAPLLRRGENELVIFELHGLEQPEATFIDHLEL